jgi:hypothetical protein
MLILLAALAAVAQPQATQPAPVSDPVVCKRPKTSDVGSHLRAEKVCMKRSDWELAEKNMQNELQTLHDRAAFNPGHNPGENGTHPH